MKEKIESFWQQLPWVGLFASIIFFIVLLIKAVPDNKMELKYALNENGFIDWKKTYDGIKEELNIQEEEDFYMCRLKRGENFDYRELEEDFCTFISFVEGQPAGMFEVLVQNKKKKFYRYKISFNSDYIETERYKPKLFEGDKYKILKEDSQFIEDNYVGGKVFFDFLEKKITKGKPNYLWILEGEKIYLTSYYIKIDGERSIGNEKNYLINEEEEVPILQEKEMENGWYFVFDIEYKDDSRAFFWYKI